MTEEPASSSRFPPASSGDPGARSQADGEAEPEPRIAVDLVEDGGDWSDVGDAAALAGAAAEAAARHAAVAALLPLEPCEVAIALSSDEAVARLNGTYRGKPKPTNVLSFPAAPGTPAATRDRGVSLGDIVLAAETVLSEARESDTPPAHHFQHLVVHAVLHLVGFDHLTPADAERMEAIEVDILGSLGIPDPYASSEPDDGETSSVRRP
ncbi:MAG: rRNA maturation RNase YbeY [Hyphomicrobiaceae bacterium]